jgi:GxxExxY protein
MQTGMLHAPITERIIGAFFRVHNTLGHGFLESVYERSMELELRKLGLKVERQVALRVTYDGIEVGHFRADLLVEGCVLVELKAARAIDPSHEAQLINYLRAADISVGLLLNFGVRAELRRFLGPAARRRVREGIPWPSVSSVSSVVLHRPG